MASRPLDPKDWAAAIIRLADHQDYDAFVQWAEEQRAATLEELAALDDLTGPKPARLQARAAVLAECLRLKDDARETWRAQTES